MLRLSRGQPGFRFLVGMGTHEKAEGAKEIGISRVILKEHGISPFLIHHSKGGAVAGMEQPEFPGQAAVVLEHFLIGQNSAPHPADVGAGLPGDRPWEAPERTVRSQH